MDAIAHIWEGETDEVKLRFLGASSKKVVNLSWTGQIDENIEDLCETLASNSKLHTLLITEVIAFGTDTGGKLLGDLLSGNSRVRVLHLVSVRPSIGCVDALCKALELSSATLECLEINDLGVYINALALQRLAKMLSTNTSIKRFLLRQVGTMGQQDCCSSPEVLERMRPDSSTEQMELENMRHAAQFELEAEQTALSFANMLRKNQSLQSLSLSIPLGRTAPKTIVKGLAYNTTLEELRILNSEVWGRACLTSLLKALTPTSPDPSKLQLKVLHLGHEQGWKVLKKDVRDFPDPEVLAEMILHNQTLETLLILHCYSEEDWEKVIVPAIAYNSTLKLVQRFRDPLVSDLFKPPWLHRFHCVQWCFKTASRLIRIEWSQPADYEVVNEETSFFRMGATYSRVKGCRKLLHMAGDFQCWSKYPSAGARWMVKTENRSYVLSFEDYSS